MPLRSPYFYLPTFIVFLRVFFLWKTNFNLIYFESVASTCVSLVSISFIISLIIFTIVKPPRKASLLNIFLVCSFFLYGRLFNLIDFVNILQWDIVTHMLSLSLLSALLMGCRFFIKETYFRPLLQFISVVCLIVFARSSDFLAHAYYLKHQLNKAKLENVLSTVEHKDTPVLPDIYYIILDGYLNNTFLKTCHNFDNSDFLNTLADEGFHVIEDSQSCYDATYASLGSTLNMQQIGHTHLRIPEVMKGVHNNMVAQYLKQRGYHYTTINTSYSATETSDIADTQYKIRFGREFLSTALENTMFEPWMPTFAEVNLHCLSSLQKASKLQTPKFIFSHITLPHAPYIFNEFGEQNDQFNMAYASQIRGKRVFKHKSLTEEEYKNKDSKGYIGQLKFINREILKVIDEIKKNSPSEPIIIIQSDHGWRSVGISKDDPLYNQQAYGILNAWHVPEKIQKQLPTKMYSVNTFRFLFSELFGENLPPIEAKQYSALGHDPIGKKQRWFKEIELY